MTEFEGQNNPDEAAKSAVIEGVEALATDQIAAASKAAKEFDKIVADLSDRVNADLIKNEEENSSDSQ